MPKLLVGNFDFEYRLGRFPVLQLSRKLAEINRRLQPEILALASPGDFLWLAEPLDERDETDLCLLNELQAKQVSSVWSLDQIRNLPDLILSPWGWTTSLVSWGQQQGLQVQAPRFEVVEWANSRFTSSSFEQDWKIAPEGSFAFHSLEEFFDQIRCFSAETAWVVKAEFGMSSRERLLGQGAALPEAQQNWLKKRLQRKECLFFEPWLNREQECSFHYQISPSGQVEYCGMVELLTDEKGRFLGNQNVNPEEVQHWKMSREWTHNLAEEISQKGYFGPLGIDSMKYRDPAGKICERPIQDVNARWTMGRCQLARITDSFGGNGESESLSRVSTF